MKPLTDMFTATVKRFFKFPLTRSHNEASIITSLLGDSTAEIELPEYQRLQGVDVESPSDLLRGETSDVASISDLDHFFERLYNYYCEKGFRCMVTRWIVELLCLAFTIIFSFFILLCINWHALRTGNCGRVSVEVSNFNCDLEKVAFHESPFRPVTFFSVVVDVYLGLFSIYWVFCFLRFFAQLKDTLEIRDFYRMSLKVTDREIQTLSWSTILERTVQFQKDQRLCVVKELSAHDIVMRIMRKDNYLIGMLNKGVLAIPVPKWVPGTGPVIQLADGSKHYLMLTKTLEWSLNWCILQYMFDRKFSIRRDFVANPDHLRKRFKIVGLTMLVLSPFLIIFMLVYFFLKHAEHFYKHPSTVASRRWSNLSQWLFREFNEMEHLFKQRLNASIKFANDYVQQFSSPILSLVAKLVSFIFGGLAAILFIIALLDEPLLEAHLYGRNLLWYTAIFGAIAAISRQATAEESQPFDPQGTMALVAQHTHYMPKSWRGSEASEIVQREFGTLFQYTGLILLEEMASIFVTPYILLFLLPQRAEDILQFIQHFTINVEGVGDVCSLSVFDFQSHGNVKYGSPFSASKDRRSCQGKMEKSFLSFKSSYPNWEPDAQGKQFLSRILDFRQQQYDKQESEIGSQRSPAMRGFSNGIMSSSRDGLVHRWPFRSYGGEFHCGNFDPLRATETQQTDHLYWLDRYYISQSLNGSDLRYSREGSLAFNDDLLTTEESDLTSRLRDRHEPTCQSEDHRIPIPEQLKRHAAFSCSSAYFHKDSIQQEASGQQERWDQNRWWARPRTSTMTEGSFFEPPPNIFERNSFEDDTEGAASGSDRDTCELSGMQDSNFRYLENLRNANVSRDLRDTILAIQESNVDFSSSFDKNSSFDLPFDVYEHSAHRLRQSVNYNGIQDGVQ